MDYFEEQAVRKDFEDNFCAKSAKFDITMRTDDDEYRLPSVHTSWLAWKKAAEFYMSKNK